MTPIMQKNLLIVTNYSLHQLEGAAYSRMSCYQKAIGNTVNVYSVELEQFPHKNDIDNFFISNSSGIFFNNSNYNKNFIQRNFLKYFDFMRIRHMFDFISTYFRSKDTSILVYSSDFFLFFSCIFILKYIRKYRLIVEKNELEFGKVLNSSPPKNPYAIFYFLLFPLRLFAAWLMDLGCHLADEIIVISESLRKRYNSHSNVIKIPVLVDTNLYYTKSKKCDNTIRFVYMGMITKQKDALFEFIDSFRSIRHYLDGKAEFHIYGYGNRHIVKQLQSLISFYNLNNLIYYHGSIKHSCVPEVLRIYDFAVLLRRRNLQTKYGFSTKLAEYLAAGLPVMTTDVSDNMLYLRDNIDSILLNKISQDEISKALIYIVDYPTDIERLSSAARETALEKFGYEKYCYRLQTIIQ
jgi:glycosyltransferase involved in cell wall biosynthesis